MDSLREPRVYCLGKGKEHKRPAFGGKASGVMAQTGGVIVGAVAHEQNLCDGDALAPVLAPTQAITSRVPGRVIVDRGYRGRKRVNGAEVWVPGKAKGGPSKHLSAKLRALFRRRGAIELVIGPLQGQYRLARCCRKGFVGDPVNLVLARRRGTCGSGCGRSCFWGFKSSALGLLRWNSVSATPVSKTAFQERLF